jgi:hypothetical protein
LVVVVETGTQWLVVILETGRSVEMERKHHGWVQDD